jgi:hypothetical protein
VEQGKMVFKGYRFPKELVARIEQYVASRRAQIHPGTISTNAAVGHLIARGLQAEDAADAPVQERQEGRENVAPVERDAPKDHGSTDVQAASGMVQCLEHKKKGTSELNVIEYPAGEECPNCKKNAARQEQIRRAKAKKQAAVVDAVVQEGA